MAIATLCVPAIASCDILHRGGTILVWTDTRGGGPLTVSLDQRSLGVLDVYFTVGEPSCATGSGVLRREVMSGVHAVAARDSAGRTWRGEVMVPSGRCVVVRLAPPGAAAGERVIVADSASVERPMGPRSHSGDTGRSALSQQGRLRNP